MFAVDCGAKQVYSCDMSKTMFEMACDVVQHNNKADRIQLIHAKSTDLQIPEDIPDKWVLNSQSTQSCRIQQFLNKFLVHVYVLSSYVHVHEVLLAGCR